MSYPSSFSNSRVMDKQNTDPNTCNMKTKQPGFSPSLKLKQGSLPSSLRKSKQSQEFMSQFGTITDKQTHDPLHKQSLRGFCSTIEETQQSSEPQQFWQLVSKLRNGKPMHRKQLIEYCIKQSIYNKQDIYDCVQGNKNTSIVSTQPRNHNKDIKYLLSSELGQLVIEQLCECLQEGSCLSQQQHKIIEFLVPYTNQDITSSLIAENYDMLKEQLAIQESEMKKLALDYRAIHNSKIVPKLWGDHFRLQIGKALNIGQSKKRLTYNCFCKIFRQVMTSSQLSIVFRYIYSLETSIVMPILDATKTICVNLLQANILQAGQEQIRKINPQQRNSSLAIQQMYSKISAYEKDQCKYLEMLGKKDQQIERLNRIIDLLKLQQEQFTKVSQQNLQIQRQSMNRKYQKRIEQIEASKREQAKLTTWYQRELEAIMKSINKQNVVGRYLSLDQL